MLVWDTRFRPKRHCGFSPLSRSGLIALWEASCHVMRTLKQPCGEVHVVRNGGLLPTAGRNWGLLQITRQWAVLEADPTPHDCLDCHLMKDPEPEPPLKPLPNSWLCKIRKVCWVKLLNSGVICYAVIDNKYIQGSSIFCIELQWCQYRTLVDCMYVSLFLDSLFCSINLYVCVYVNILSWLL